jgi:hypothetical protein
VITWSKTALRAGRRHDEDGGQKNKDRLVEKLRVALGEAFVHQLAQAEAHGQHRGRRHGQGRERARHLEAIGPHIAPKKPELAEVAAARPLLGRAAVLDIGGFAHHGRALSAARVESCGMAALVPGLF